ncbi:hypothetical protein C0J52_17461 [Blattella germanica]|nr:hypothetical protein C0J52_17461 [Blattella germanica]
MEVGWAHGETSTREMGARSYNMGSIYREEMTRTAKTQMGRHVHSRSVKTCKRQKKVERTRKIILIRTKVKLDYKSSKCVDRVYASLLGMAHQVSSIEPTPAIGRP